MTHNMPTAAVSTDAQDLDQHIDVEAPEQRIRDHITQADARRVWIPTLPLATSGSSTVTSIVWAGTVSVIAMAFMMAFVGRVLPSNLGPLGMAMMFYLAIPISIIYWGAYIRQQHLHDAIDDLVDHADDLEERIIEMEQAITERLDVLVRNV